jgi:hypothetical protein
MTDSYKKCPKGHIHNSETDECPYCNGKKIEDALEDLPDKQEIDHYPDIAMCYDMGPCEIDTNITIEENE